MLLQIIRQVSIARIIAKVVLLQHWIVKAAGKTPLLDAFYSRLLDLELVDL